VVSARPSTDPGNLVEFGGDGGLFVETDCASVRSCLSEGPGIDYDPVTGQISARPSTDPGNTVTFGGDGGLFAAAGAVDCATVRACISAGQGAAFVPATGVVSARPSTDVGNTVTFGGDGGLFVPPATVTTGCGLTGDGSAATPVTAATSPWTLPCPVDDGAGLVYCDSAGLLRSEPRGQASFVQQFDVTNFANVPVPAGATVTIVTDNLAIPNPDPCREAIVIIETEVDVDMDLPANSGGIYGIAADDMVRMENRGAALMNDVHWQVTKVFRATIPAGGAIVDPIEVRIGGGFGGATYSRIQTIHRAWVFSL
jgi:hypothetical protein